MGLPQPTAARFTLHVSVRNTALQQRRGKACGAQLLPGCTPVPDRSFKTHPGSQQAPAAQAHGELVQPLWCRLLPAGKIFRPRSRLQRLHAGHTAMGPGSRLHARPAQLLLVAASLAIRMNAQASVSAPGMLHPARK